MFLLSVLLFDEASVGAQLTEDYEHSPGIATPPLLEQSPLWHPQGDLMLADNSAGGINLQDMSSQFMLIPLLDLRLSQQPVGGQMRHSTSHPSYTPHHGSLPSFASYIIYRITAASCHRYKFTKLVIANWLPSAAAHLLSSLDTSFLKELQRRYNVYTIHSPESFSTGRFSAIVGRQTEEDFFTRWDGAARVPRTC